MQGFTGRDNEEEFGLMYYRARYYDPDTGRFISPDPFTRGPDDPRISYRNSWYSAIHGEATLYASWLNPHSFNRYLYCNNNPVGYVDPLGLDTWNISVQGVFGNPFRHNLTKYKDNKTGDVSYYEATGPTSKEVNALKLTEKEFQKKYSKRDPKAVEVKGINEAKMHTM